MSLCKIVRDLPDVKNVLNIQQVVAETEERVEMQLPYKAGDPVIFVVSKSSTDPGPRAKHVHPAPAGETYSYQVEKFWTVADVRPDGRLVLVTRRGKQHEVDSNDFRLRHARWWEKWFYRNRFPGLSGCSEIMASRSD